MNFGRHLAKSARSLSALTAVALPLAACSGGAGGTASLTGPMATGAAITTKTTVVSAAGMVAGAIDRANVAGTTSNADTRMSIGATVTAAMAGVSGARASATSAGSPAGTSGSTSPTASSTSAAPASAPASSSTPVATNKKSISAWVSCGTAADDTSGAQKAFAAASQNAFTLVVDCPVHLKSGLAIDRGIFIDNGTSVEFTGTGKFYVDNMFHPAFVIADSSNITLTNWNVEWDGIVPVNPDVGGYIREGAFVSSSGVAQPAAAFNDVVLTGWLTANRKVTFDETQGWVKSIWVGGVNLAAVFYLTGDTSNVVFTGLTLSVPAGAGGDHFLPMAVSFSPNWNGNQTVNGRTPHAPAYATVPHGITFSGVSFDGTLMGFQGNVRDAIFENMTSHRYGDVMDASGGTTGGIGKWFPPPHLLYLNYVYGGDPGLFNTNIHISNIQDLGPRIGVARDKGGTDTVSGYALSLKLGCTECSVDNYTSNRPDGFLDLLPSQGLTITNVTATVDSAFINNAFPAGIRFPATGYSHVSFDHVSLTDTAESTIKALLGNAPSTTNDTLVFSNFLVTMNRWAGSDLPLPTIGGPTNDVALNLAMSGQSIKVSYLQNGPVITTLEASPVTLQAGASTVLTWGSRGAGSCSAGGAWSGALGTGGTKVIKIGAAGNSNFSLACQGATASAGAALFVTAR